MTNNRFFDTVSISALSLATLAAFNVPQAAMAQADPADVASKPADNGGFTELVVTARKKNETLLEVPLAITAFSSAEIAKRNVQDLSDVASFTPSINVSSPGNASATSRTMQTVVIRGMVAATYQVNTTTVFINGAPLAASGLIDGLSDVAQIEVIKGPQSAYFGRATFAGAINIITKAPGNDFRATFDGLYGSYNWTDLKGSVEGAVIPDVLKARISVRSSNIDGQYRIAAQPSYAYGAQSTKSVMGELEITPASNLQIRMFGSYTKQNDGLAPLVKFTRSTFNCNPGGAAFICGQLPQMLPLGPNANIDPSFFARLQLPAAQVRYQDIGLDHAGAASQILVGTTNINWTIPGSEFVVSAVTAYNRSLGDSINDLSNQYETDPLRRSPFETYSYAAAFSQELRVTSDQKKRLRGLIGVNYQWQRTGESNIGEVNGIYGVFQPTNLNRNQAFGIFGSASYDIIPKIILNLEGRYQIDKSFGYSRVVVDGKPVENKVPGLETTTHTFLPRVILQYKFVPSQQVYFSYAKGSNPGIFNSALLTYPQELQDRLRALTGATVSSLPEKVTNFEVGYKASLFDNHLQVELGAYFAKWRNQLIAQTIYVLDPALTGSAAAVPIATYSNLGKSNLKGLEAALFFRVSDYLSGSAGGSINDSKILSYANSAEAALLGVSGTAPLDLYNGNQLPKYSKYSGNVALDYERPLTSELDGFVHVDYAFKSRMYEGPANLTWTPNSHNVNLRAGIIKGKQKFELFVENLTNNQAYNSITNQIDINDAYRSIAYGSLPMPRRFGVRLHVEY
jgi:iron complex outermembrane receptor protein